MNFKHVLQLDPTNNLTGKFLTSKPTGREETWVISADGETLDPD